jgi:CBS domain-containing protein
MNLTQREIESYYCVGDFMTPLKETPYIKYSKATTKTILECVENGNMGVAVICGEKDELRGIVSSADIRKALLKNINQPAEIKPDDLINESPISIASTSTVIELLQLIKSCAFPVMYLPVVDESNNAVGIINFVHLIKGEI